MISKNEGSKALLSPRRTIFSTILSRLDEKDQTDYFSKIGAIMSSLVKR